MDQLKPIAETLETTFNKIKSQCYINSEVVEIGSLVLIKSVNISWLAITTAISTGSKFPGGIQPLGITEKDIAMEYPELSFIETKTLELELLTIIQENIHRKPTTIPNPHSTVYKINDNFAESCLENKMVTKSIASAIIKSPLAEIVISGLLNQINLMKNKSLKKSIVEQLLLDIYTTSNLQTDLIKKFCQIAQYNDF